jgi:gliding motility-associated-like protein
VNAGSDQSICGGGSVTLTASASVAGITWSPAANLSCTNCATTVASPPSTTVYIATASVSGCSRSDSLTIAVSPKPVVSAGPNKQFCKGATTFITASSSVPNYSWSPVTGLSCTACLTPTVSSAATTTYTLIGFGVGGCSDTAQVVIKVNPIPFIDAGIDQTICEGNAVQMNATGTGNFIWTPNNGSCSNCPNPIFTPSVSTSYAVSISDANGCTNNDQLYVTVNKYPSVNAGPSVTINYGESVTLSTNSIATTYCWSTEPSWNCFANTASCIVAPLTTTTYYLSINQIQNPCGQAMDSLIVKVNYIDLIGVPNAFTPNSDGMDDYFFPFLGSNQLVVMHIYNRWGEIVYSTNDSHSLGWDGKFKGVEQPIGTYMYYIEYKKEAKNKIQLKGDITLIR